MILYVWENTGGCADIPDSYQLFSCAGYLSHLNPISLGSHKARIFLVILKSPK
ncbi:hypothetical protein SAMN03080617_02613 [Algoriphagus alkaliphilus]|uniref:Uncharacterized protein n=1 Tax=Algoriphagus alkaliphilus TaxID=279824 RepID=A0A1G5YKD9_9BACT|nr:hypothetical protein SAMN03080617_02613 [Algoriphagus alkaliphilus]